MRPLSDLDVDPIAGALAVYLEESLNSAVSGFDLVKKAIPVDAFLAYLHDGETFPLLQCFREQSYGQGTIQETLFSVQYFYPPGFDLITRYPGLGFVVRDEIEKSLIALKYRPDLICQCKGIDELTITPGWTNVSNKFFATIDIRVKFS